MADEQNQGTEDPVTTEDQTSGEEHQADEEEGADQAQEDEGQDAEGEDEGEGDEDDPLAVFPEDLREFAEEFETSKALSEESYAKLAEKGFSREVVDAYIEGATSHPTEEQADELIEKFGGEEAFGELQSWGSEHLSAEDKQTYALGIANRKTAAMAVEWLAMKRELAGEGNEPETEEEPSPVKLRGGKPKASKGDVFTSKADVSKAMRDKRYGRDRAYTAEVEAKVARSRLF